MDNAAVIPTGSYKAWWDALSQESRRNARLAAKKEIVIRDATFNEEFVKGIKQIYDETPMRQGRQFWHYNKELAAVERENGTYLERARFLGAYYGEQLVGFAKIVQVGDIAVIMQILCLDAYRDKRPMTALVANAVRVCHEMQLKHLVYGKFYYGRSADTLAEFKRRLGFEEKHYPRYYVPLSWRGHLVLKLGLHEGWRALLPAGSVDVLRRARAWGTDIYMRRRNAVREAKG